MLRLLRLHLRGEEARIELCLLAGADHLEIFDAEHSESEDRFIAIGPIDRGLVVVVYTEREEGLTASVAPGGPPDIRGSWGESGERGLMLAERSG